jgi:glutaredoxin 3
MRESDAAVMPTIVYVKPRCPYCADARRHLRSAGEAFEERDATANDDWRAELMDYTGGAGTVPTIVRGSEVQVGFPPGHG